MSSKQQELLRAWLQRSIKLAGVTESNPMPPPSSPAGSLSDDVLTVNIDPVASKTEADPVELVTVMDGQIEQAMDPMGVVMLERTFGKGATVPRMLVAPGMTLNQICALARS